MCAVLALTSCSKEELPTVGGQNPDGSYTFNIGIEEPDYVVSSAPKTRATMGRYLMEMYEGSLSATPVKIENSNGVFNVELKKGVDYVCLFWADGGAADYDAASLKAVKQTDKTKTGKVAYCASVTVNNKTFNGAIKLKRAVAELSFIDKNGLTDATNTLKITYPYASATLNVGDGTVIYDATGTAVRTITGIAPPTAATTAFTTDFILAPKEAGKLAGLKFQLNEEEEKTVAETAVQANFRTKITGEYWKDVLKVGDYYMQDGTWLPKSTVLTADQKANCLGIVFVVNAYGTSGKIVSLDEPTANWNSGTNVAGKLKWGPVSLPTYTNNDINGLANMNAAKTAGNGTFPAYSAFAWVHSKNAGISNLDYSTATKGVWYLPATKELRQLYAAMSGLKWVASGAVAANGEINDWGNSAMPKYLDYADARTDFNALFTAADKTTMDLSTYYWPSLENGSDFAWRVYFDDGSTSSLSKLNYYRVRAVLAF